MPSPLTVVPPDGKDSKARISFISLYVLLYTVYKLAVCSRSSSHSPVPPLPREGWDVLGGLSNRIGGPEARQVAAERALLGPVCDGGLEEAAAAQLEEGGQVPHDAHAVEDGEQRG